MDSACRRKIRGISVGDTLKGNIMRKFYGLKSTGIILVLLIMLCCAISTAQETPADEQAPLTAIEQKMRKEITLNFRNAPIDDILRSISEQVQLNIVKSPQITETVTVDVRDVPLEEALNQILTVYGCGYVASENMIRIVPVSQLTQESERLISKIYRIWYADAKEVQQALSEILSDRGSIAISASTNNLIVTDTESTIKAIDAFLTEIDRPTPLIMVEVRIYDIKNSDALDLGVKWRSGRNTGYGTGRGTGIDGLEPSGGPITGNLTNSDPFVNGFFENSISKAASTGSINWGVITEHFDLDVLFTAIQEQDAAKLLANPRILVLDNETASFKAIEEIPYQQLQQGGYQSFGTTEFKEVGVELQVTPHLAKDGMIKMHIVPVFSVQVDDVDITTIGTGGVPITSPQPVVDKREADTVAMIQDGQTVVIGGLQKQTVNKLKSKVPVLGDLPLLGWLFNFEGEQTVNNELVVFITPNVQEQPKLTEIEEIYLERTDIPHPLPPETKLDPETGELKKKAEKDTEEE